MRVWGIIIPNKLSGKIIMKLIMGRRRNLLLVTYKAFYYLDVDRNEWNAEK